VNRVSHLMKQRQEGANAGIYHQIAKHVRTSSVKFREQRRCRPPSKVNLARTFQLVDPVSDSRLHVERSDQQQC
jgi:hypothetical protein